MSLTYLHGVVSWGPQVRELEEIYRQRFGQVAAGAAGPCGLRDETQLFKSVEVTVEKIDDIVCGSLCVSCGLVGEPRPYAGWSRGETEDSALSVSGRKESSKRVNQK